MDNAVKCPECEATLDYFVDGIRMSLTEIKHLPRAPKNIKRRMDHSIWCSKIMRGEY